MVFYYENSCFSVIQRINNLINEEKYEESVTLTWYMLDVFPQISVFASQADDEE